MPVDPQANLNLLRARFNFSIKSQACAGTALSALGQDFAEFGSKSKRWASKQQPPSQLSSAQKLGKKTHSTRPVQNWPAFFKMRNKNSCNISHTICLFHST
jgi:hypothetical protein